MTGAIQTLILSAAALGGLGVYLMMPRGEATNRRTGAGFAVGGFALLWIIWIACFRDVAFGRATLFCLLASLTVISGVMTVTRSNPVSCALWFTSVVIGTAGLFLLQNAQFLAAAIVVVYAGAIIVMFLFVVMMAQQHGVALCDRVTREPGLAVLAGFVLLAAMISSTVATYRGDPPVLAPAAGQADVSEASTFDPAPDSPQVAALGRALFTDHWLSLEVAGTMLLVAMVGAILISARDTGRTRGGLGQSGRVLPIAAGGQPVSSGRSSADVN